MHGSRPSRTAAAERLLTTVSADEDPNHAAIVRRFETVQSIPPWYFEYVANAFATRFADATDPGTAAASRRYMHGLMHIPEPRFVHLDAWFGELMRERAPDGTPAFTSAEGRSNFGWYQAAVARLAEHVFGRNENAAIAQIRDMLSGRRSLSTAEILAKLEAIAPGARALLDSMGVEYAAPEAADMAGRIRVEHADDLPVHTYPVAADATAFPEDDDAFTALAEQLETDLRSDLAAYATEDVATLKSCYDALADLALQRGRFEAALAWRAFARSRRSPSCA